MELRGSLKSLRWQRWQRWAWGPVSRLPAPSRGFQITPGSWGTSYVLKRYIHETASWYRERATCLVLGAGLILSLKSALYSVIT